MRSYRWSLAVAVLVGGGAASTAVAQQTQGKPRTIDFSLLGSYDYTMPDPLAPLDTAALSPIPAAILALHGKRIQITGFMLPIDLDEAGSNRYILNGSLDMCYFGAPVRINEWIMVTMNQGKKARFTHLPMRVTGVLEVGEEIRNGRIMSLYRLHGDDALTYR